MDAPTFSEFEQAARREGYDEIVPRDWPAGAVLETHDHPFAVKAIVVAGEMWLTHGGKTQHLKAGDRFELDEGVPHAERYGTAG
ncbi:MAG TPA: cupin domain-containing protein, partial [Caldimonas sp.]|nr:cupin domain-containing protein [Caldimonas sp.]